MAIATISTVSVATGVRFDPAAGFDGVVLRDAVLVSTDNDAIQINDGQQLTVYGMAHGNGNGILATATQGAQLVITSSAQVTGGVNGVDIDAVGGYASASLINNGEIIGIYDDGLEAAGSGFQLLNNGTITGSYGLYFSDTTATNVEIDNAGTIAARTSTAFGVTLYASSAVLQNSGQISHGVIAQGETSGIVLKNSGTISANSWGSAVSAASSLLGDTIQNTGTIGGTIETGGGDDVVFNAGIILGDVLLSDDGDLYKSTSIGTVEGEVYGQGGDDTLIGGNEADEMDGGDQSDVLRGRGGDDTLAGNSGVDRVIGGTGDDFLFGGSDADTLKGGDGDDTVYGDYGADRLFGGNGEDAFALAFTSDSGIGANADVVLDFVRGDDQVDISALSASTFAFRATNPFLGGGAASVRYVVSGGNAIVRIDVNGDSVTDSEIVLNGISALSAVDFIL